MLLEITRNTYLQAAVSSYVRTTPEESSLDQDKALGRTLGKRRDSYARDFASGLIGGKDEAEYFDYDRR